MPGTDLILTHCGVVDPSGKILPSGRAAFIANVTALLMRGNADGKGLLLSSLLGLPMPPDGGPEYPAPNLSTLSLEKEKIFYFTPDPISAALSLPYLADPESLWSKVFVDGIYATIASGLNLPGSYTPALFDPTIWLPDLSINFKDFPFIKLLTIDLPSKLLPQILLKLKVPALPIPPIPTIPTFKLPPFPPIPELPTTGIPPQFNFNVQYAFPDLFLNLTAAIPGLIVPSLPTSLPKLFLDPFSALLNIFLDLLIKFNVIVTSPKLLIATMLTILHNIAVMIACDIIGSLLGTGAIVKSAALFGGLTI